MSNTTNFYERADLFLRNVEKVPDSLGRIRMLKEYFKEIYKAGYQTGYNHQRKGKPKEDLSNG